MKLSEYAKQQGISYRTAFRWWQAGQIPGYQAATGTLIVNDPKTAAAAPQRVAIYARVSSHEHQATLDWQAERLVSYCAAKGYQVSKVVKEIASGVNDSRPKLLALLEDQAITLIVVEHQDRLTRFGFRYLDTLLRGQSRAVEVVHAAGNETEDLLADLTAILYRFTARLYGQRRAKRTTETVIRALEAGESEGEHASS
jgi:predicted site-specific integrase-resolvase